MREDQFCLIMMQICICCSLAADGVITKSLFILIAIAYFLSGILHRSKS